jgi:hypothetical protein
MDENDKKATSIHSNVPLSALQLCAVPSLGHACGHAVSKEERQSGQHWDWVLVYQEPS